MASKKQEVQYRHYEVPPDSPVLALLGERWIRPYGSDLLEPHFHNLLEIGYCYEGTGQMVYGDECVAYRPGSITVIPPNCLHNTISSPGTMSRWEYLFVDVKNFLRSMYECDTKKVDRLFSRICFGSLHIFHEDKKALGDLVLAMTDLYRHKEEMYLECAKGLLQALLVHIARRQPDPLGLNGLMTNGVLVIHDLLEYIGDHYQEALTVAQIAEACHMSETQLRRLFSRYMHMSPLQYLNHVRIEAACRQIRSANVSIRCAAESCGFSTASTFNRNFREIMGVSPLQWRKETTAYQRRMEEQNVILYNGWR